MKQAMLPATSARRTRREISARRVGTMAPTAPIRMPRAPRLLKPHSA